MHTLSGGGDKRGNRKLLLSVNGDLLIHRHAVRFHQRKAETGHVLIAHTFAVQRVKANPRARFRLPVAYGRTQVIRIPVQGGDKLPGGAVKYTLAGYPLAVLVLPRVIGDVAHMVIRIEKGLQVQNQILGRLTGHHRVGLTAAAVVFDDIIPVHDAVGSGKGRPAPVLRHLYNRRARYRRIAAVKGIPAPGTLAGVITPSVPAAPLVPYGKVIAFRFQGHADPDPLVMGQVSAGNAVQCG